MNRINKFVSGHCIRAVQGTGSVRCPMKWMERLWLPQAFNQFCPADSRVVKRVWWFLITYSFVVNEHYFILGKIEGKEDRRQRTNWFYCRRKKIEEGDKKKSGGRNNISPYTNHAVW